MAVECGNTDNIRNMVDGRGDTTIAEILCEVAKNTLPYFVRKGKVGQLKALLSLGAIQDVPAEDGSTAFTMALGTLNTGEHGNVLTSQSFLSASLLQSVP